MRNYLRLTQKTIRELREKGVELDPIDDIEHIERIMLAARRVDEPIDPEIARRAANPCVMVGGVALRSLPYGAHEALQGVLESGLCKDMDEAVARAYACARAADYAFWQKSLSPRAFLRESRRWARKLKASLVEIAAAVEILHRKEYDALEAIGGGGESWGIYNMLESLMREYDRDKEYWLWTIPMDDICGLLYAIMQRAEKQEREASKQSKGKFLIDIDSWSFQAIVGLTKERDKIIKEKQENDVT